MKASPARIGSTEICMKALLSLLVACFVLPVAACAAEASLMASNDQATAVTGNNEFAFALYGKLRGQDGNLFFSPESVSTALAMTYAGARGGTPARRGQTPRLPLPPHPRHP